MTFTQTNKVQVRRLSNECNVVNVNEIHVQGYGKTAHSVVLDYAVNVKQLKPEDQMLGYGELGNFSVAGFEMVLNRYSNLGLLLLPFIDLASSNMPKYTSYKSYIYVFVY